MSKVMSINGKPVVDATKSVKIEITGRDIDRGNKKDPAGCAAALAIKRETNCTKAFVHLGRVYVDHGDKFVRYQTPAKLRTEVVAFDRGGNFAPGEYTLRTLPPSSRSGERNQGGKNKKKTGTGKKRPHISQRRYLTGVRHHGGAR